MKRFLIGLFCLFASGMVLAAGPNEVRKRVQASMLVTGSIVVAPDGTVRSYVIDHSELLPPPVVGLIERNSKAWRFKPILLDGEPVAAKGSMSLRIVAKPVDKNDFALSIAGAQFGQDDDKSGDSVSYKSQLQPRYPPEAAYEGVSGTVYMLLLINRQGQVGDASVEVVDMGVVASDLELSRWRRILGSAALAAAKRWTFNIPTSGKDALEDHWVVRVPVTFSISRENPKYGGWNAYVPGPEQPVPWIKDAESVPGNSDALADGGLYQVGHALQLMTPLGGA